MDKYLIDILKENKTIIIPGLGALTITNEATGEVMFMPYLKHDEGTLTNYIAEREGWEENEAKNLISKYVREIQTKLDQGDTYDMFQFGTFKKIDGDIAFERWTGNAQASQEIPANQEETHLEEEIAIQETANDQIPNEEIEEIQQSLENNEEEEEVATEMTDAFTELIINTEAEDEQPTVESSAPEIQVESTKAEAPATPVTVLSEEEQMKDDLDVPPINQKPAIKKKPILEKTVKDKKPRKRRVGLIITTVLGLLLGSGAIVGYFQMEWLKEKFPVLQSLSAESVAKSEIPEVKPEKNTENEVQPEEIQEPMPEDNQEMSNDETTTEVEVQPEPVPTPVVATNGLRVDKSLRIQAITGSFGELANAERMAKKFQDAGHQAMVIGPYGGLHMVTIGSFASKAELEAGKSQLSEVSPKYWVKK